MRNTRGDLRKYVNLYYPELKETILKEQKSLSIEETELNSIAFLEQLGYTCITPGKGQKPAEWGEEDSRMLSDIVGYITGTGSSSGITKQERVNFLYGLPKRFNLQPK